MRICKVVMHFQVQIEDQKQVNKILIEVNLKGSN
jgi:hypothetical protein